MEVVIQPTPGAATLVAAGGIARLLREKPNAVLGLPTGSTPLLLYRELARLKLDWSRVTTFNLDEYVGLMPQQLESYHRFMWDHLFQHVNIRRRNVHIPDGLSADMPRHCRRYEEKIRAAGGIDLQVLGLGTDGHIGFNEPFSSLASRTRVKALTARTRRDNARFFGSERKVPHHAITMGIGTIMEARQCLLLAFGARKARAVAAAVEGPISARHPASILQMHPATRVCLDEAAAGRLTGAEYFRWAYEHKPEWQR